MISRTICRSTRCGTENLAFAPGRRNHVVFLFCFVLILKFVRARLSRNLVRLARMFREKVMLLAQKPHRSPVALQPLSRTKLSHVATRAIAFFGRLQGAALRADNCRFDLAPDGQSRTIRLRPFHLVVMFLNRKGSREQILKRPLVERQMRTRRAEVRELGSSR